MRTPALAAVPLFALAMLGAAWQPATSPRPAAAEPAAVNPELAKLKALAGVWKGEMEGDPVEETWSAPMGDSIIGMFRWQHAGKTTLFETIAITPEDGGLVLRLRHFGPKLEPWKDESHGIPALKATKVQETTVIFENQSDIGGLAACEYRLQTPRQLEITVKFKDPARPALVFTLKKEAK